MGEKYWIARDKNGRLNMFYYGLSLYRGSTGWSAKTLNDNNLHYLISLPDDMFPNLRWEDEPIRVNLRFLLSLIK